MSIISQAEIVGPLGAALYTDEAGFNAVRLGAQSELIPCPERIGILTNARLERRLVDGITRDQLLEYLREETAKHRALVLVLSGADPVLRDGNRRASILLAEACLRSADVRAFVESRLLACRPPDDIQFDRAREFALKAEAHVCEALYARAAVCLPYIARVLRHFEEVIVLEQTFAGTLRSALHILTDAGILAEAVRCMGESNLSDLQALPLIYARDHGLQRALPRLTHILSSVSRRLSAEPEFEKARKVSSERREYAFTEEDPWLDELNNWIASKGAARRGRAKREPRPWKVVDEIREKIDHQVHYIERLLSKRNLIDLDDAVLELIRHQRESSDLEHVCMTLSRLGTIALEHDEIALAERLYTAAQVANTNDRIPRSGYAEVLRESGRLDESLALHALLKAHYKDDPIPFCGYAEVLREMGRFDEALGAYSEAREMFPDEPFPFSGYAETLRDKGDLEGALAAYTDAKVRFPSAPVIFTAYARTLRAMGQLEDALKAYAEAIEKFPTDAFPVQGYAEVLRETGRFEGALAAYSKAKEMASGDPVPYCGYAATLRDRRCLSEAEGAYREVLRRFPGNRIARNALASLVTNLGRPEEALRMLHTKSNPTSKRDWRDYHVVTMATYRMGKVAKAIRRLDFAIDNVPFDRLKSRFLCALAALKLRDEGPSPALDLLGSREVIPFPEWAFIRAHAEAEAEQPEKAHADLDLITFYSPLRPAIALITSVYGLGQIRAPREHREQMIEQLWEEEFRLLTDLAA